VKKLIALMLFVSVLFIFSFSSVKADTKECTTSTNSYGQTSEDCKVLGETTTITHQPVNTGVGGLSFLLFAGIVSIIGFGSFRLAKLAERTYWFD
jgi:hypothetical protein